MAPDAEPPGTRAHYDRSEQEFSRATAFFDATFAIAATLLVTTIVLTDADWSSWSSLWNAASGPLIAFGISFAVVVSYWKSNHDFVRSLQQISSRFVLVMLVMLAFVALLPVPTRALGEDLGDRQAVVVVYAINVAVISATEWVCYRVAIGQGLLRRVPDAAEIRVSTVNQLIPSAVFVASVPITLLVGATAGQLSWLSLAVLMPLAGVWAARTTGTD